MSEKYTRRVFLKTTGAAMLAVAAAGALTACGGGGGGSTTPDTPVKPDQTSDGDLGALKVNLNHAMVGRTVSKGQTIIRYTWLVTVKEPVTLTKDNFAASVNGTTVPVTGFLKDKNTVETLKLEPASEEQTVICVINASNVDIKMYDKVSIDFNYNGKKVTSTSIVL